MRQILLALAASGVLLFAVAHVTPPAQAADPAPAAEHTSEGTPGQPVETLPGEEHQLGDEHAQAEDHHGEGGMPQLNGATYPSQILWLVIGFITLYFLLKRKALPRVADILETRQERIAADLDRAAQLRQEAEQASQQYEKTVAEAQERAQAQLKAAHEAATADAAAKQDELDKALASRIKDAEKRIEAAKQQALQEVNQVALEVVQAAAQRLAGIQVSQNEVEAAIQRVQREAA